MKVFILGGTGTIGAAVTSELVTHGHSVTALSRSPQSDETLHALGAIPLRGDLRTPQGWVDEAVQADAVIQLAATFSADMAEVDQQAMEALQQAARARSQNLRLIYTGGCWLYGATGDRIAGDGSPMRPIAAFDWMKTSAEALLEAPRLQTAVIHPAMVYHERAGAFERFFSAAEAGAPIEIWGSINTRWPLVHRDDLSTAYRLLIENPELTGHFNVSAETGVHIRSIVSDICTKLGHDHSYIVRNLKHAVFKYGDWAEGPTLDQQMMGTRIREACGWTPRYTSYTQALS